MPINSESDKEKIANAVVDAHIVFHNIINPNGFGHLDCESFSESWEQIFRNGVDGYYKYLLRR